MIVILFISSFCMTTLAQDWPTGVHDPSSMIKCGDKYWIFATGNGIYSKYSTDMITWKDGPTPFPYVNDTVDFPAWILKYAKTTTDQFNGYFWAPDIIYMNNKYYLYYSCSVWGTMSSCIGVVVNQTLDSTDSSYQWVDQGDIGIYSSGGDVNAIDPSVMKAPDGKVWLTYGSFNKGGIMITEIDSVSGKPKTSNRYSIANSWTGPESWRYGEGEGGCTFYRDGYYYLVYNKGGCCAGVNSSYYMVVGRASSPTGSYVDKNNKLLRMIGTPSGGTVIFKHDDSRGYDDRFYGPGHFGLFRENEKEYVTFHYYDPNWPYPGQPAGGPRLGLALLKWDEDGWPSISMDFLDKGVYTVKNVNSSKMMDVLNHSATSGSILYQYAANSSYATQKWVFTPLGTGEYTISSYADDTKYLEATGANNDDEIKVASSFTGAVNQKFRLIQSVNGDIVIYPSVKDKILEVPNASTNDSPLQLWFNTNNNCQRWAAAVFNETLVVNDTSVELSYLATTYRGVNVSSNGVWKLTVEDDSWLTVTPTTGGSGKYGLAMSVTQNDLTTSRTNKVTFRTNGGLEEVVTVVQTSSFTSVNDVDILLLNISPNPTKGIVKIECVSPALLTVYNNLGTKIIVENLVNDNTTLDISNLLNGIYLFKISSKNGTVIRKIVKQ